MTDQSGESRDSRPRSVATPSPFRTSNINITGSINNTFQIENSVIADPLNPLRLLCANNSYTYDETGWFLQGVDYFVSIDGGLTWSGNVGGVGGQNKGDPSTAMDRLGRMYIGLGTLSQNMGISISADGGQHWQQSTIFVGNFVIDRPFVWCDANSESPYVNNIYAASLYMGGLPGHGGSPIIFSKSVDHGVTWSGIQSVSDGASGVSKNWGANIQTGPNGEVYVTWAAYDSTNWLGPPWGWSTLLNENAIGFARSLDGGTTFSPAVRIQNIRGHKGMQLAGGKLMRHNSAPSMAVDQQTGRIFIVWTNYAETATDPDIFMISSSDRGDSWSLPTKVNQDTTGYPIDQWSPWLACDPVTGLLCCVYYDCRSASTNDYIEAYVSLSNDHGVSWKDYRLSKDAWRGNTDPFAYEPGDPGSFAGDYIGITSLSNRVCPVWTDGRSGKLLSYAAPFKVGATIRVPQDKATIQAALDTAFDWDTVLVSAGTYSGTGNTNLDFQGKALILRSSAGAAATTINCNDAARALLLQTSELTGSRIVGFTFKDGYSSGNGGAVYANNVSVTFNSCVFLSCQAQQGGAVYADSGTGTTVNFNNCTFDGNYAGVGGAAIYTKVRTHLLCNTFVNNTSDAGRPAVITVAGTPDTVTLDRQNITNNGTYALDFQSTPAHTALQCCNFWQNTSGNVNPLSVVLPTIPDVSNTVITQDPLYCNFSNGVYSLRWDSPCSYEHQQTCSSAIGAYGVGCGTQVFLSIPTSGNNENPTPTLVWHDVLEADQYTVQVDNNSNFSSPERIATALTDTFWVVSPGLGDGTWYWRVCGKDTLSNVTGPWSAVRSYTKVSGGGSSSCPILFAFDSAQYHKENPLLTACENNGYQQAVTDYYHVAKPVGAENGLVRFQLREMEDEISYINSLALMTVDHDLTTKVACGTDGRITLYRESISPLTAVDQSGIDRLREVRAKDGVAFTAEGPGYLEVTFPNIAGDIVINPGPKLPCQEGADTTGLGEKVAVGGARDPQLQVEVRDSLGHWVSLGEVPTREEINQEFVGGNYPVSPSAETVTIRISWSKQYDADVIQQVVPISETPLVQALQTIETAVSSASNPAKVVASFSISEPLVLVKGDILDFSFDVGEPPNGQTRDYIIVATGRYEPTGFTTAVPSTFELSQNYPNPFNPSTTISFDLPVALQVKLSIYNSAGQTVRILVDERMIAGRKSIVWDGADSKGRRVASGAYFYKIEAGEYSSSRKMILLK
jgi:predicted outer membrane repeat protein